MPATIEFTVGAAWRRIVIPLGGIDGLDPTEAMGFLIGGPRGISVRSPVDHGFWSPAGQPSDVGSCPTIPAGPAPAVAGTSGPDPARGVEVSVLVKGACADT